MTRLAAAFALPALALLAAPAQADQDAFWERLTALCGQSFDGESLRAPEGDDGFDNVRLVMHVRSCEPDRIRIPFVVGDDLSRTWVLTRHEGGIELRHDHRHEDGTEEDLTQYGGVTPSAGTATTQIFPADDATLAVSPRSYPNVWMMAVDPEAQTFTYFVQRLGTERAYHVEFDLSVETEAPPAPWGWQD